MAKRRKKRTQRAKGGKGGEGGRSVTSKDRSSTEPADADSTALPLAKALRAHPVALLLASVFFVLFGGLYLASLSPAIDPTLTTGHTALGATPTALVVFGAWCLAAAYGLLRRTGWGWWAAATLAQYEIYLNILRAVLSDVSTELSQSSDVVLVTSAARLTLWLLVGLYLHGFGMASHFHLPWLRDEERKRTHRVITYGIGVLVALYIGSRYLGSTAPVS